MLIKYTRITKFKYSISLIVIASLILVFGSSFRPDNIDITQGSTPPTHGVIKGSIVAEINVKASVVRQILLENVGVTIKDLNGNVVDTTSTMVNGSFHSKILSCGQYSVSLSKKGFKLVTYDAKIENPTNSIGFLKIEPSDKNYIFGSVLLKDGKSGYYEEEAYGISIRTYIKVKTSKGILEATCNSSGNYLITGVNPSEEGTISATCQDAVVTSLLNGMNTVDLTLPGSTPIIDAVFSYNEVGRSILRTRSGTKIKLKILARDTDGNQLHYKWVPYGVYPGFESKDSPELQWKTPASNARYVISVLVTNGVGGVAYRNYTIVGGNGMVSFSGTVINLVNKAIIPFAKVRLNGKYTTHTDSLGYFSLNVPENENERYVIDISKPGFSLCSKIFKDDATQKFFKLLPSSGENFSPLSDIEITEKPDAYTNFKVDNTFRSAAHLSIPKNSIVDSTGKLVTTPVTISIRAVEASNSEGLLPGNFGGITTEDNKQVRIESLGSVDVQIRDKNNPSIKYNLSPSAKAELSLPIHPQQIAGAPATIPLWDYNEATGLWEKIGMAVKSGNVYKGITNRFSFLSAGLVTSNGTYIVLKDNPTNSVFTNGNLFVSVIVFSPQTTGGVLQCQNIGTQLNAADFSNGGYPIVNLPANSPITIEILQNGNAINTLNIVTGPVIAGAANTVPVAPAQPYSPTAVQVFMKADGNLGLVSGTSFLTLNANLNLGDADRYYKLIGAYDYGSPGHHITFNEWKRKNGYTTTRSCDSLNPNQVQNGMGDLNTVYFNAGDLGFWRGLHQKTYNGNISFYVGNYHSDNEAIHNNDQFASVCMEYSPIIPGVGNVNVTKFYIFDGTGNLVTSANLDGNGLKSLPGLCVNCHGGSDLPYFGFADGTALQNYFNDPSTSLSMPNFLPFDLKSYGYSTTPGYKRDDIEEVLRKLNNVVLSTKTTKAIRDFVNASYHNNINTPGQRYDDESVVDIGTSSNTWNNSTYDASNDIIPKNFYRDVVAPGCRSCHITRDNPALWFDTKDKFLRWTGNLSYLICDQSAGTNYMPHAKKTYENFWQSQAPSRPNEIKKLLIRNGISAGDCN